MIYKFEEFDCGCKVNDIYLECLLYADDIILLSQSVRLMHNTLDIYSQYAIDMDLQFNTKKSVTMRTWFKVFCEPM